MIKALLGVLQSPVVVFNGITVEGVRNLSGIMQLAQTVVDKEEEEEETPDAE